MTAKNLKKHWRMCQMMQRCVLTMVVALLLSTQITLSMTSIITFLQLHNYDPTRENRQVAVEHRV